MTKGARFNDQVAIVTGGASGIGRATCHLLASERAKVVIADINIEAAKKVVAEIKSQGGEAIAVQVDIRSLDGTNRLARFALDNFGKIDILENIAGGGIPDKVGPFAQSDVDTWHRIIDLNLYGTLNCCRSVINHMIERRSGKIVNVSSNAGTVGQANTAAYSAAKGGIISFTKALAKELAPYGINVNCVSPAAIASGPRVMSFPEEHKRVILSSIHLGRLGKPEEVASVLAFLASYEADFVTGANYIVDGGLSLSRP